MVGASGLSFFALSTCACELVRERINKKKLAQIV